jgi:hypothetical protein
VITYHYNSQPQTTSSQYLRSSAVLTAVWRHGC